MAVVLLFFVTLLSFSSAHLHFGRKMHGFRHETTFVFTAKLFEFFKNWKY